MINSDFNEKLEFWGREFDVEISFERHKGENILDFQEQIYHKIKDRLPELLEVCKTKIYEYVEIDEIKSLFPNKDIPENIFKFIIPKAIFITRETDLEYFGFLFYFRYDRNDDMCVSFKNFEFFRTGAEYIIL